MLPLGLYFLLSIFTQVLSYVLWMNSKNNLLLHHIYVPVEFFLLVWFYNKNTTSKPLKYGKHLCFVLVIIEIVEILYINGFDKFNTITRSVESLLVIFFAILWYANYMKIDKVKKSEQGLFLINTAFFLYFFGSVLLFSLSELTMKFAYKIAINVWSIHTLLLTVMYCIILMGIIKWKKNQLSITGL